jgi:AraC-like DNA-binding protein
MLVHTDEKITWIANHLGFEDASYFSRFFRKETGLSPEKFRIENNSQKNK